MSKLDKESRNVSITESSAKNVIQMAIRYKELLRILGPDHPAVIGQRELRNSDLDEETTENEECFDLQSEVT